jgi:hypothetical protein
VRPGKRQQPFAAGRPHGEANLHRVVTRLHPEPREGSVARREASDVGKVSSHPLLLLGPEVLPDDRVEDDGSHSVREFAKLTHEPLVREASDDASRHPFRDLKARCKSPRSSV